MKSALEKVTLLLALLLASLPLLANDLDAVLAGDHRSDANRARDAFRNPVETLEFFQVQPGQTVVEIWPGAGWYTEVLAPYLKGSGTFHAAHFPAQSEVSYFVKLRAAFEEKLAADPDSYGDVTLTTFDPGAGVLEVPDSSADRVVTFRNVHSWLRSDSEQTAFELFFKALKPGGLLGVVEHRTGADVDRPWMLENGYMTEASVIALAETAGFELVARSDINANPADSADHPAGVWTLPPSLRLGDEDREKYHAIGESDRMTLLFRKPE